MVAETRNLHTSRLACLDDGGAGVHLGWSAVDGDVDLVDDGGGGGVGARQGGEGGGRGAQSGGCSA